MLPALARRSRIVLGLAALAARRALTAPAAAPGGAPARVLVLGYAAVGDLIFMLPALKALRDGLPRARITFVADKYPTTDELLPATGLADEIWQIDMADDSAANRRAAAQRIAAGRFDAAVMSLPTSARFFADALLSAPVRVGHCRAIEAPHAGWSWARYALWRLKRGLVSEEFERRLVLNRKVWVFDDAEHIVSRNLRLAAALGVPVPDARDARPALPEPEAARESAARAVPAEGPPWVGLHLGSPKSQYGKLWPPERWAAACAELRSRAAFRLVLVGGADEAPAAAAFAAAFGGPVVDLTGRCGLLESFAVVRRCRLFLSNDTGLSKAAMAMGVPTATVWGPSDRPGWGALWDPERHLEVVNPVPCAPCVTMGLRREGPGVINYATCGHRACLAELAPARVAAAVWERHAGLLRG